MPSFSSKVNLVLVDVAVHDKKGETVKGLTADDFELLEDGRKQQIVSFAFEEISNKAQPMENRVDAVGGLGEHRSPDATGGAPARRADAGRGRPRRQPMTSDEAAGRRLMTLLFDTSSMAAGGRAEGGRVGAEVGERADGRRRSGGRGVHRHRACRC